MIVGLVSSYREGVLVQAAVESALAACDVVWVADGRIGDGEIPGAESDLSPFRKEPRMVRFQGKWATDAAKRNALLEKTRRYTDPWAIWIDGDETVINPRMLRHWVARAAMEGDEENAVGGFPIRIVELDGSVALSYNRIFRCELIERFIVAAYHVGLKGGMEVSLPNVPHWNWQEGGRPGTRPPLQGEPHILHLSGLRRKDRGAPELRLHEAEADWFRKAAGKHGLGNLPD